MFPSDETPAERSLRGRMAVHRSWANTADRSARTARGRSAFEARFERQVDPEGVLPAAELRRRAEAARRAYFAELALKSSQARRRKTRPAAA